MERDLQRLLTSRWEFAHVPLHSAAYLLNPAFMNYPVFDDSEIIKDFKSVCKTLVGSASVATALIELEQYKINHDRVAIKPYLEIITDDNKDLLNMMYWCY